MWIFTISTGEFLAGFLNISNRISSARVDVTLFFVTNDTWHVFGQWEMWSSAELLTLSGGLVMVVNPK